MRPFYLATFEDHRTVTFDAGIFKPFTGMTRAHVTLRFSINGSQALAIKNDVE
jgi:hypothetical protein